MNDQPAYVTREEFEQLGHVADDMVLVKAALNSHGNRLNVLTQDVREIRTEMGEVRTEMGHIRATLDGQEGRLNLLDTLAQDAAAMRAALAPQDSPAE